MKSIMVPLTRVNRIPNHIRSIWKYCLSFRKQRWELHDYPISVRTQEPDLESPKPRLRLPRYVAMIENWYLSGLGESKAEALEDLQTKFTAVNSRRESDGKPQPRPGTNVPIEFASQERVNAHSDLAQDFIHRVLELDDAWISDKSSLWDFNWEGTNERYHAMVKSLYEVDISDIKSGKLCEILERIAAARTQSN